MEARNERANCINEIGRLGCTPFLAYHQPWSATSSDRACEESLQSSRISEFCCFTLAGDPFLAFPTGDRPGQILEPSKPARHAEAIWSGSRSCAGPAGTHNE